MSHPEPLPIESVAEQLRSAMQSHAAVILSAEPGAGKTTRVPLLLLHEPWLEGKKIIMLEPRRLATRRAAEYMSAQLGEAVGTTVGYRIRGEARTTGRTRIEVVTEGILTRMLQANADLPDVGVVIFDEFHERSIHADLGLALTLDVQSHLRNELRVLIMSATLNGIGLQAVLPDAPMVVSSGKQFAVETIYAPFRSEKRIEDRVTETVTRALHNRDGDILVFLPGRREIARVAELLADGLDDNSTLVHQLYGEADHAQQNAALAPALPGIRKVILSTNIAETSLTIDGVRVVVDSGRARVAQFNPRRGMSGLVTANISRASADQRRGRAGRQAPGICFRLWTEGEHTSLAEFSSPEIKSSDLTPLALDLALWGAPFGEGLRFIDPPPKGHLAQSRELLTQLGALDASGNLMPHGRAMHALPVHPRLAHMILRGAELNLAQAACTAAALLEERDPLNLSSKTDADIQSRLDALESGAGIEAVTRSRILRQANSLRQLLNVNLSKESKNLLGLLIAFAYPDRIARKRLGSTNRFLLRNGTTGFLMETDRLARSEFIAVAEVDDRQTEAKVFLAATISEEDVRTEFSAQIEIVEDVRWDSATPSVVARRVEKLGAVELSAKPMPLQGASAVAAMIQGVRSLGIESLPWTHETRSFCARVEWLRKNANEDDAFPAFDAESLMKSLEEWFAPFLDGVWRADQLKSIDLEAALKARLLFDRRQLLDTLAPPHLLLPSGTRARIDYESGTEPVLAVRLQELFGQIESPRVGNGVPLLIHLLSPAKRPLAVTKDLHSFWTNTYPALVKQLRMKYPKHVWPENPLTAKPTNRTKRRGS